MSHHWTAAEFKAVLDKQETCSDKLDLGACFVSCELPQWHQGKHRRKGIHRATFPESYGHVRYRNVLYDIEWSRDRKLKRRDT